MPQTTVTDHEPAISASTQRAAPRRARLASYFRRNISWLSTTLALTLAALAAVELIPTTESQSAVLPWMANLASSLTGQPAKPLNQAPLVQLDTSSKYHKALVEGLTLNFKKTLYAANEQASTNGSTSVKTPPLTFVGPIGAGKPHELVLDDLQVEGLDKPRVSSLFLSNRDLKLHVSFLYKQIRLVGRLSMQGNSAPRRTLLEAQNWNATWTGSVLHMIGRDHLDLGHVSTSHSASRTTYSIKDTSAQGSLADQLQAAMLERVKLTIDARLTDVIELVLMQSPPETPASSASNFNVSSSAAPAPPLDDGPPSGMRARRNQQQQQQQQPKPKQRVLKRTKRQTPCKEGDELDDYVDQLFRFGTRIIRAMEPVTLPNATIELPDYNLKIFLYDGKGTRAYKFRRVKPAWVFCNNETISLGITVELEDLRVAYKYRVISGYRLLFDGDLEARLAPRAQAQFSQAVQEEDSEEPVQQRVDRVRVFRLGRVHVLIRGLGNLTQSLSLLINSFLNDNQQDLQPTLRSVEGDAVRAANRFISNLSVPILSVV